MQKPWRHMAGFLAAAILLGSIPAYAETETIETEAAEVETSAEKQQADTYTFSGVLPDIFTPGKDTVYDDAGEAAYALRSQLMMRSGLATINYNGKNSADMAEVILNRALDENVPAFGCSGDYLKYHYMTAVPSANKVMTDNGMYYQYEYRVTYLSSTAQEAAVEDAVSEIIKGIDAADDMNKISDIYRQVVADGKIAQTENKDYNARSAYAALIEKRATSEGYAAALYCLLQEAGIDCRIVSGKVGDETQAWNIVKLNGLWYYLDAFEDLGKTEWTAFLKGEAFAQKHVQTEQEQEPDTYQIASKDYTVEGLPSVKEDAGMEQPDDETQGTLNETQLWINQCYVYLFGREGNTKELADSEQWFNDHEQDVQALLLNLMQDDEFNKKYDIKETGSVLELLFTDELFAEKAPLDDAGQTIAFIYKAYNCFLGRQPDLQGLKKFVSELRAQQKTPEEVCAVLIDSDEGKRVKLNDEAYVTALYIVFLGRTPDPDGKTLWLKELKKGSRKDLLHAFANSDECKKKYPDLKYEEK